MTTPTLTLVTNVPDAVKRAPVLNLHKVLWTLRADYPAPHGTVYLRFSDPEQGDNCLDVITPQGRLIQRLLDTSLDHRVLPRRLQAGKLTPGRNSGALLQWEQLPPDASKPDRYFLAFPEGFTGLCTLTSIFGSEPIVGWNGIRFVDAKQKNEPDVDVCSEPAGFPKSNRGLQTRFAAAIYGNKRYVLRWGQVRNRYWMEVLDTQGRLIALHWLKDDFAGTAHSSLGAMWLDERRKRGPVLEVRDSDSVRLYVFTEGFKRLLCAQNFNDSSSSISATTVSFDRDKRGLLTVTESYSERPDEEGHGGSSSETTYIWKGSGFDTRK